MATTALGRHRLFKIPSPETAIAAIQPFTGGCLLQAEEAIGRI